jgi:hypothetical protein
MYINANRLSTSFQAEEFRRGSGREGRGQYGCGSRHCTSRPGELRRCTSRREEWSSLQCNGRAREPARSWPENHRGTLGTAAEPKGTLLSPNCREPFPRYLLRPSRSDACRDGGNKRASAHRRRLRSWPVKGQSRRTGPGGSRARVASAIDGTRRARGTRPPWSVTDPSGIIEALQILICF